MSIVAEPYKEIKGLFPQGKIILHDGRMLDCYPLAAQVPDKISKIERYRGAKGTFYQKCLLPVSAQGTHYE